MREGLKKFGDLGSAASLSHNAFESLSPVSDKGGFISPEKCELRAPEKQFAKGKLECCCQKGGKSYDRRIYALSPIL